MGGTNQIKFLFDKLRATAAAAVVVEQEGGRTSYFRLIKLLYLADRTSIDQAGHPIVGGNYVSMDHGPVISEVLDLVNGSDAIWSSVFRKHDYDVELVGKPDLGPLSLRDIELLKETVTGSAILDRWKLRDITHTFEEWQDPHGSSLPIIPESVLAALGKSAEEVEEIRQASNERVFFDKLFSVA